MPKLLWTNSIENHFFYQLEILYNLDDILGDCELYFVAGGWQTSEFNESEQGLQLIRYTTVCLTRWLLDTAVAT